MAYLKDSDLEFLENVSSSDLNALVEILTKEKDGNVRFNEKLTKNDRYKKNTKNHHMYWDLIATEIQCFGANTIATKIRGGEGVLYKEVLNDACDKMKVNYDKEDSVEKIESKLLMEILTKAMEKMTPDELKDIVENLNLNSTIFTAQAVTIALQGAIKLNGFASYQLAVIVANAVAKTILGHGLAFAANAGLMKVMGIFAGPIGWGLTGLWTLLDIAGPAYRVTIPSVVQVAFLRAKMKYVHPIALQASNSMFICSDFNRNNFLFADRNDINSWETFSLFAYQNNKYSLQASNGLFVSADQNSSNKLVANRVEAKEWEFFEIITSDDYNTISLIAHNKMYVCSDLNDNNSLVANRTEASSWETFKLINLSNKKIFD